MSYVRGGLIPVAVSPRALPRFDTGRGSPRVLLVWRSQGAIARMTRLVMLAASLLGSSRGVVAAIPPIV